MKIIIDVNLAVRWADMLLAQEIEAVHWTEVGAANAIQIRAEDTRPEMHLSRVASALIKFSAAIEQGAVITIDPVKTRLHILPYIIPEKPE